MQEIGMGEEVDEEVPDLFHKSSLKQRADPLLDIVSDEVYEVKKWVDGDGNRRINQYVEGQPLGRGAFGIVIQVLKDSHCYAMKSYFRLGLRKKRFFAADGDYVDALQMLQNQLNIVKRLNHPNIAKCHQILHSNDYIYLIMELGSHGQIMKWNQLENKYYRNTKAYNYLANKYATNDLSFITKIIFVQVCQAIQYLHHNNITNRDIKVDNILVATSNGKLDDVKVVDFTTTRYSKDDISYFPSGTPGFRGPEHQFASYDGYSCKASDVWSIGICAYVFYYENFPFYGETELDIDIKSKNIELTFDENTPEWLVRFIRKTTCKNWRQRVDIDQALKILQQQ